VEVINNIVYNNGNNINNYNSSNTTLSNNLTTDPGFINPSGGDFHLTSGSPAKDAGVGLPEVPCDIEGNARPAGGAYDIGAYEQGGTPSSSCPKGGGTGGGTPTPAPTPTPPQITLSANPSTLSYVGQGTQLYWSATNATSRTASGGWSGSKNPSGGNERVYPPAATIYILSCQGSGGSAQKAVTVSIGSSGSCATYTSGSSIPQGFGVPWDVMNPASLLLKAECAPPSVTLSIGDSSTLTYVYKTAYVAADGATSWAPITLFGAGLVSNAWFPGMAQGHCHHSRHDNRKLLCGVYVPLDWFQVDVWV
jgi:hypothetical protein